MSDFRLLAFESLSLPDESDEDLDEGFEEEGDADVDGEADDEALPRQGAAGAGQHDLVAARRRVRHDVHVDVARLADVVARIGDAALALGPSLDTFEVNPLLAHGGHIEALDALATYSKETPA